MLEKVGYILAVLLIYSLPSIVYSAEPIISAWKKCNGTGYGGYTTNVKKVEYSDNYVYVSASDIPDYSIGPWSNNPNTAKDQSFVFKYPRTVTVPTTKFKTALGHIGQFINGVSVYNPSDGMSYNNLGYWNRNAYFWEGSSFDGCYGHPDASSEYHHHVNPKCLYTASSTTHSPLLGFGFDGIPIYGPYAYSSANASSSSITRMKTSYKLRSITVRDSYSNGTKLTGTQVGPTINSTYPLGAFLEDYEYSAGYGDLDEYNGRYGKTPDFPNGVYAYFVTIDSSGNPEYPFAIGIYFYGKPEFSNIGPTSGKTTVSESTITYFTCKASGLTYKFGLLGTLMIIAIYLLL